MQHTLLIMLLSTPIACMVNSRGIQDKNLEDFVKNMSFTVNCA
jgi:hypothetical protein